MAQERASAPEVPFLTRRMVEWTIVALVIVLLALVFSQRMRVLQGQAELAAVRTTLGALRTSLVIDHLRKSAALEDTAVERAQHNPFELLQRYPGNYFGQMSAEQAQAMPSGGWVFDPDCGCVGYLPIWGEWFDSPSGDLMAWFRVRAESGPLQLVAKEKYLWQGVVLN